MRIGKSPPASVPPNLWEALMMYIPERGHVVWARLWLLGTELDPAYRPMGLLDVLVEPDRLWPVRLDRFW